MKELRSILIIIIVVGMFTALFTVFTGAMYSGYENVDNVSYIGASQETIEQIEEMQDTLQNTDTTLGGTLYFWGTAPFRIGMMVFSSINIIQNLATDMAIILHVPVIVIDAFIVIMVIIIMFGLLKIIQRSSVGGY